MATLDISFGGSECVCLFKLVLVDYREVQQGKFRVDQLREKAKAIDNLPSETFEPMDREALRLTLNDAFDVFSSEQRLKDYTERHEAAFSSKRSSYHNCSLTYDALERNHPVLMTVEELKTEYIPTKRISKRRQAKTQTGSRALTNSQSQNVSNPKKTRPKRSSNSSSRNSKKRNRQQNTHSSTRSNDRESPLREDVVNVASPPATNPNANDRGSPPREDVVNVASPPATNPNANDRGSPPREDVVNVPSPPATCDTSDLEDGGNPNNQASLLCIFRQFPDLMDPQGHVTANTMNSFQDLLKTQRPEFSFADSANGHQIRDCLQDGKRPLLFLQEHNMRTWILLIADLEEREIYSYCKRDVNNEYFDSVVEYFTFLKEELVVKVRALEDEIGRFGSSSYKFFKEELDFNQNYDSGVVMMAAAESLTRTLNFREAPQFCRNWLGMRYLMLKSLAMRQILDPPPMDLELFEFHALTRPDQMRSTQSLFKRAEFEDRIMDKISSSTRATCPFEVRSKPEEAIFANSTDPSKVNVRLVVSQSDLELMTKTNSEDDHGFKGIRSRASLSPLIDLPDKTSYDAVDNRMERVLTYNGSAQIMMVLVLFGCGRRLWVEHTTALRLKPIYVYKDFWLKVFLSSKQRRDHLLNSPKGREIVESIPELKAFTNDVELYLKIRRKALNRITSYRHRERKKTLIMQQNS